jgi:hypothetical protein
MGFLSKLFGGDAAVSPGKAVAPESAPVTPELKSAVVARAAPSVPPPAAAPPAAAAAELLDTPPLEASVSSSSDEPIAAPEAPASSAPVLRRAAPEQPRRPGRLEDSVVTSAPRLPVEPAGRGPLAPRPPIKPSKTAAPTGPIAVMERVAPSATALDSAISGQHRPRLDRSKSPGFYSVSPITGASAGATSAAKSLQKATVMGLAPPPGFGLPKSVEAAQLVVAPPHEPPNVAPLPDTRRLSPSLADIAPPETPPTEDPAVTGRAGSVAPEQPESALPPASAEAHSPPSSASIAPAQSSVRDPAPGSGPVSFSIAPDQREEKEETSPGLGRARSRHDLAARLVLPEQDLDLLVEFIMDLALGSASDAWLEPLRPAVLRLKAAAAAVERAALEKALGQFGAELDVSVVLSEPARHRLLTLFAQVDMLLPLPSDVARQRALRERLIVDQLLGVVAGSYPLFTQRLRDEGYSLEHFSRLRTPELSEKLGASRDQAAEIVAIFQGYLLSRSERGPELALLGKLRALKKRLGALEVSAAEFERVSDGDDSEARRLARRQRQTDVAQLTLLLAERGEARLLAEIERCSVQAKIQRIHRWLTEITTS